MEPVIHLLLSLIVSEVSEVSEILLRVKNNKVLRSLVFIIASSPAVAEGIAAPSGTEIFVTAHEEPADKALGYSLILRLYICRGWMK